MSGGFFSKRPWLLVWIAFVVLIAGWIVTYAVSQRAPWHKLTPAEESALIIRKESAK